jgi:hypothetical protein
MEEACLKGWPALEELAFADCVRQVLQSGAAEQAG